MMILAVVAAADGFILGGLSLALGLSEQKCQANYYRDISVDQVTGGGHGVYGGGPAGGQHSIYGVGGQQSVYGVTNLGFSADSVSLYGGSKHPPNQGLYMTPYGEDDG